MTCGYEKTVLENGIRIITDNLPGRLSVSAGIWSLSGSRYDPPAMPGLAHLLEHILFRGTKSYSSRQISEIIEYRGGSIDGFTNYDITALFVKLLSDDLETGIKILIEMVSKPLLDEKTLESEKKIIIEEILSDLDDSESRCINNLHKVMWKNYPLAHEILGNPESVMSMTIPALRDFLRRRYCPSNIIAAAVGDVDHQAFCDMIQNGFDDIHSYPIDSSYEPEEPALIEGGGLHIVPDDTEQSQCFVIIPLGNIDINARYGFSLITALLGGGSSSRLFQRLREKEALAYSTGAWMEDFVGHSFIICYTDTGGRNAGKALELMLQELDEIAENGIDTKELDNVKCSISGKLALSTESTSGLLQRLMINELILGDNISIEESIANYKAYPKEMIKSFAKQKFNRDNMILYCFGNIPKDIKVEGYETSWHLKNR